MCKGTCMAVLTWKSEHGLLVAVGLPILPCGFWVMELRSLALAVAREVILSAHRTFVHFFNFVWKSTQTKTHGLCCIRVNTYKTSLKLIKTEYFQLPPRTFPVPLSSLLCSQRHTFADFCRNLSFDALCSWHLLCLLNFTKQIRCSLMSHDLCSTLFETSISPCSHSVFIFRPIYCFPVGIHHCLTHSASCKLLGSVYFLAMTNSAALIRSYTLPMGESPKVKRICGCSTLVDY